MAVSIGSSTEQREHLESLLDKLMFHDLVTFRGYPGILALLRWRQFRPKALAAHLFGIPVPAAFAGRPGQRGLDLDGG